MTLSTTFLAFPPHSPAHGDSHGPFNPALAARRSHSHHHPAGAVLALRRDSVSEATVARLSRPAARARVDLAAVYWGRRCGVALGRRCGVAFLSSPAWLWPR